MFDIDIKHVMVGVDIEYPKKSEPRRSSKIKHSAFCRLEIAVSPNIVANILQNAYMFSLLPLHLKFGVYVPVCKL